MSKKNELLIKVAERYMLHSNYKTDNPFTLGIVQDMCDVETDEMWMLTQKI